jgi:benzoate-CoA ligase family protein
MLDLPEYYNVSTMLDGNLEAGRGGKIAIYCGDERVTYDDLYRRVCRMGRALRTLGVGREQRVLLVLSDTPAFPVAFFGAIRVGAVPVPINPLLREDEYRHFLEETGTAVVIADAVYVEKVRRALHGHPDPVAIVVAGVSIPEAVDASIPDCVRLEELLAAQESDLAPARTHRDDMAFWLYSGGSTGRPKGVVHVQHDIPYTCQTYARHILEIQENDRAFGRVLFHAYGLGNSLSFPFSVGASTILYPARPTPAGLLETIQKLRPTLFFSVPTLFNAILNDPASRQFDVSSIRRCVSAAEPLPPETWRRWKDVYAHEILDGIGSTEMLHIYCSNRPGAVRPGSTGTPVPGYELRRRDYEGRLVGDGGAGILEVRGNSAAPCYWRQPERSQQTMRGEWIVTGDLFRVDEDGFYWYQGRADDLMKVGGEWISPIEMENALIAHPAVREAAVVGISLDGTTRIQAVIVLEPGTGESDELTRALQDWCKDRLQRYKYPHCVMYVSELPKTTTGKVQRFQLRQS